MKKNFFKKKLASGLALALVVASLAPAGISASAATVTTVVKQGGGTPPTILYVGGAKVDYGLSRLFKGNKYAWTVSDSSIATITTTTGVVTAKAPGTVTITCTARNSAGTWLNAFKHTLTVKQRVDSVDIGSDDFELTVGDEKDLDAVKIPAISTDAIRYYSSDEEIATVDPLTGIVKAVAPGKAVITVYSKALWNTPTTSTYNRTDSVEVTVIDGIQAVKQTTPTKIEVTLATDQSEKLTKDNLIITDANGVKQIIKEVKFSTDGKVATAEVYISFVDKATYKVAYADTEKEFVASVGDVAAIALSGKTVKYAEPSSLDIKLYDANGVEVTTTSEVRNNVTFEYDVTKAYISYDSASDKHQIVVFNYPEAITVKAIYHTYEYEGTTEKVFESTAVINSVEKLATLATNIQYTLTTADEADWTKVNTTIPAGGRGYNLFIKAKDQNGNDVDESQFDFESTDVNIVAVTDLGDEGVTVYGGKAGVAYLKATFGDTTQMLAITVGAASQATAVTVDKTSATLYSSLLSETETVTFTAKDQYNSNMPVSTVKVDPISEVAPITYAITGNKVVFTLESATFEATTTNTYRLTYYDRVYTVRVTASKVADFVATSVKVVPSTTSTTIDSVLTASVSSDKRVTYTAYEYNRSGQKIRVADTATYTIRFKNDVLTGTNRDDVFTAEAGIATFSALKIGGEVVTKASIGTYVISAEATIGDRTFTDTKTITVTDSQAAVTASRNAATVTATGSYTVADAIADGIKFSVSDVRVVGITGNYAGQSATLSTSVAAGGTLYITKLNIEVPITLNSGVIKYVEQEVTVGIGLPIR